MKVLLNSFQLNGHILGFYPPTSKLKQPFTAYRFSFEWSHTRVSSKYYMRMLLTNFILNSGAYLTIFELIMLVFNSSTLFHPQSGPQSIIKRRDFFFMSLNVEVILCVEIFVFQSKFFCVFFSN